MNGEIVNFEKFENNQPKENEPNNTRSMTPIMLALLLIVAMSIGCLRTQHHLYEQKQEEAHLTFAVVSLLEDRLLLVYGVLPSQVGLGELRDVWIDNPCNETLIPYYQALEQLLDELEGGTISFESDPQTV